MRLIAGLGNPGPRYAGTRHNAGFLVVEAWARRHGATFRPGRNGPEARVGRYRVLEPDGFMNRSGAAIQAVATRNGIGVDEIVVVHDDLDLPLGRMRVRTGGGAGGQKGVRDVIDRLGADFVRLKVGIGRPPARWTTEHWVLSRFRDDEQELLDAVVETAADALEAIVQDGPEAAANRFNGIDLRAPDPTSENRPEGDATAGDTAPAGADSDRPSGASEE